MNEIALKYNMLNQRGKREVNDLLDKLLSKQASARQISTAEYKKRILKISVWSEDDLKVFKENQEIFNQWTIEEW